MKTSYKDLIEQTFEFPQEGFEVRDSRLFFRGIDLMEIIDTYGTPLKLNYLPRISERIQFAQDLFDKAMRKVNYEGNYVYCYCTKSSHFLFVMEEALKNNIHLETSSDYDIHIIRQLYDRKLIDKNTFIVHNGYKKESYCRLISGLINDGFNCIPVLDNKQELLYYKEFTKKRKVNIGLRIAIGEEPKSNYYTSRLGIRNREIMDYYRRVIMKERRFKLKMLHFFIDSGIEDTTYYWSELHKCLKVYCDLKKICPTLDSLNIGGGFPIKHSLGEEFDYAYMTTEIVANIKRICNDNDVPEPNIFTEFGSFTVGESGATIYQVIDQKKQNDVEVWNMIDSSFITTLPDSWAINERFILLAVNRWDSEYERVNMGGITCDSQDYYNVEAHVNHIFLPKFSKNHPQYIGFFNTGAYQNTLGGYGGLQHCLVPSPRQVIVRRNHRGEIEHELFCEEQDPEGMLKTLGYL